MSSIRAKVLGLATVALILAGCSSQSSSLSPTAEAFPTDGNGALATSGSSPVLIPCPHDSSGALSPTVMLPAMSFECLGGGPSVSLAQLRGRPLIMHIWASWCTVCREDMPVVLEGQSQLGANIRFIGVNWKDDEESARGYAAAAKLTFPNIADPRGRVGALWSVNAQPATVFIRADGTIAHTHLGAFRNVKTLVDTATEYLR